MRTLKRRVVIVLVGLVVAVHATVLVVRWNAGAAQPLGVHVTRDESLARQRAHAAEIRDAVGAESLDTLIDRLKDLEGFLSPGYHSSRIGEEADLDIILSNRRVLRLLDVLRGLSRNDARLHAIKICDSLFEECRATVDRVLTQYEDPQAPKYGQSLAGNRFGLGGAVFALAHSGTPVDVVAQLERNGRMVRAALDRVGRNKSRYGQRMEGAIQGFAGFDDAFQLTVLVYAIEHAPEATPALRTKQGEILRGHETKVIEVPRWDAETTQYDWSHVLLDDPVDQSKGVERVKRYFQHDPREEVRKSDAKALRKLVAAVHASSG